MSSLYSIIKDKRVIRGDTLNIKEALKDKTGRLINELAQQGWDSVFTLRDPITDEPIVWKLHEEKDCTADNTTDTITSAAHGYEDDDIVQLSTDGTLPAGLSALTNYYIVNSATNTFQLSLTRGGAAIDFTDDGTGNLYVAMNSKLQKTHNDVSPAGDGIYYNGDTFIPQGLNITQDNQLIVVLSYKETAALDPEIYPFDIQFSINQMYKSVWSLKGNLIVEREETPSVE